MSIDIDVANAGEAYNRLMTFFRWLARNLSAALFSFAVFSFALLMSLYMVLHTPKPLEAALQQSGIYGTVVQDVLEQTQTSDSSLPLSDPGIQTAIQSAVPASTVQASAEQIINSTYNWLNGAVAEPNFNIDLSPSKAAIADNVSAYVQQKLTALPICPPGTALPGDAAAIFSMTCRPDNASVTQLVDQAQQEARGDAVLKDTAITSSTFKDAAGQPLTTRFSYAPKLRRDFLWSLYGVPAVIVLSALGVIFASKTKRAGVRRLCVTLLTTGIYSLAIAWVTIWLLSHASMSLGSESSGMAAVEAKAVKVAQLLAADLRSWWFGLGIGYAGAGIIGLLAVHFTRPKQKTGGGLGADPSKLNTDTPPSGTTLQTPEPDSKSNATTVPSPKTPQPIFSA